MNSDLELQNFKASDPGIVWESSSEIKADELNYFSQFAESAWEPGFDSLTVPTNVAMTLNEWCSVVNAVIRLEGGNSILERGSGRRLSGV